MYTSPGFSIVFPRFGVLQIVVLFFSCFLFATFACADDGYLVWAKSMGGTLDETGKAITVDSAGNVYTAGTFEGTIDLDPGAGVFNLTSAGNDDIFISKLDSNGNFVWANAIGGASYDNVFSIFVDDSGSAHITGEYDDLNNTGEGTVFIAKLDSSGSIVWDKTMDGGWMSYGTSIFVDQSGFVYTTGTFEGTVDFDPGPGVFNLTSSLEPDLFFSKLDSNGDFIWAKATGAWDYNWAGGIFVDVSGNTYTTSRGDIDHGICTSVVTTDGYYGAILNKLDSSGNCIWAKIISSIYYAGRPAVDASGNVYTTGIFSETVDFDPGPGVFSLTSVGDSDVFISKLDSDGIFVWAKAMGGTSYEFADTIFIDDSANLYTTGTFAGTVDFDPGPGVFNLTSSGGGDIFISKLDSNGNFVWAKAIRIGAHYDSVSSIIADDSGDVYTTGGFTGTVDFDPATVGGSLTSIGGEDIFVTKHKFEGPGPFNLSVSLRGNGVVMSSPAGISCPVDCSESYEKNTSVTLTAIPVTGAVFGGWSGGGCTGSGTCTVTMDRYQEVTASFGKKGGVSWSILLLKNRN